MAWDDAYTVADYDRYTGDADERQYPDDDRCILCGAPGPVACTCFVLTEVEAAGQRRAA